MFRRRKEEEKEIELSDDKIIELVLNDRTLREKVIESIKDDVEDKLNVVLVEAIKQANERPSKWWEWLFLLFAGALAGVGIGFVMALQNMGVPTP